MAGLASCAVTDAADDGWFAYNYPPYGADGMHAHATRDADGRWVLNALFLHGEALSAETLRGISIPRMEAKLALDVQDPDTRERMSRAADDALTIGELRKRSQIVADEQREQLQHGVARRRQLTRPDGLDPDEFYQAVASAYGAYAVQSNAPAKLIATEADVPVGTAHRWIREARRRGFLPPARKGRAG